MFEGIIIAKVIEFVLFVIMSGVIFTLIKTIKDLKDLLEVIVAACEDERISNEELKAIIKEYKDLSIAVKALVTKVKGLFKK